MVVVLITAVVSEYLVVTKRFGAAKAWDAKAKTKIINSKGRRYVFIVKDIGSRPGIMQSTANYVEPNF